MLTDDEIRIEQARRMIWRGNRIAQLEEEVDRLRADVGINGGDFQELWEAYGCADPDTLDDLIEDSNGLTALDFRRQLRAIVGIDALKAVADAAYLVDRNTTEFQREYGHTVNELATLREALCVAGYEVAPAGGRKS